MNKLTIKMIALSVGFACSAGAMAESLSKDDFKLGKEKIAAEYRVDKSKCDALSGNPKSLCVSEANGRDKIALADLNAAYEPTSANNYKARMAKVDADLSIATERCNDKTSNAKDVCIKEAKSAHVAGKADVDAQMKIWSANATADKKSNAAHKQAKTEAAEARKDAAADKRDAQYSVAKEKCDAFAGDTKDQCLVQAKATFGKS
jgi:hypothetical protein